MNLIKFTCNDKYQFSILDNKIIIQFSEKYKRELYEKLGMRFYIGGNNYTSMEFVSDHNSTVLDYLARWKLELEINEVNQFIDTLDIMKQCIR